MMCRYAVIMAGGRGERFWPLSTSKRPKQLLALVGGAPLIAQAVDRIEGLIPPENVFVVTSAGLIDATIMAAPQIPPENIFGEPIGRDTAAAIACGAALVKAKDPTAVFAVFTADQVVGDPDLFAATLKGGLEMSSRNDILLTIGIQPTRPATEFGYIEAGETLETVAGVEFCKARHFVEKPDAATAAAYLDSARFFWNSGMFIWTLAALEKAFAAHCPEWLALMNTLTGYAQRNEIEAGMAATYPDLAKISIDYALMEKADNIVMACGTFAWDDVGSWPALENHFEQDAAGNTLIGNAEVLEAEGNIVYSKDRLTALIGVKGMVVVQAEGVTLVCPKERTQDIKKLVTTLRGEKRFEGLV